MENRKGMVDNLNQIGDSTRNQDKKQTTFKQWDGHIEMERMCVPKHLWVDQFMGIVFQTGPGEYLTVLSANDNNITMLNLENGNTHVESYGSFKVILGSLIEEDRLSDKITFDELLEVDVDVYDHSPLTNWFNIRNQIINNKLIEIKENSKRKNLYSPMVYYKEHATINLDFGRQTGSTHWLTKFLKRCENDNETYVVIIYDPSEIEDISDRYLKFYNEPFYETQNIEVKTLPAGSDVDYIIIDPSGPFTATQLKEIYKVGIEANPKLFILL